MQHVAQSTVNVAIITPRGEPGRVYVANGSTAAAAETLTWSGHWLISHIRWGSSGRSKTVAMGELYKIVRREGFKRALKSRVPTAW